MRTVFLTLGLFIASTLPALAASPHNTYTHHTAFAVPEQSYQLAATWFLPDWQAGMGARTDIAPAGSGDRHDLTCSVYGGCLGIPANMTCSDDFTVDGKTCYKSCSCKSGFVPASSSDICKGCYNPCDAHTAVDAPYGCEKYFSDCASKCEKAYPDNCHNRTAVTDLGFGCEKYFDDCSSKCEKAYADNCRLYNGVDEGAFGCKEYYDDCPEKCKEAYPDNCHKYTDKPLASSCPNGCAQGKTYADCSSKCSVGCKASCDAGYYLSADELSCSYDLCQKYGDKPLVSSCANGCALDTTAEGCSDRCATGCKAKCSSPKTLTSDQLACQCPQGYTLDGTDTQRIAWGEECDGKKGRALMPSEGFLGFSPYYHLEKNTGSRDGYSIFPVDFSFRGQNYSFACYYPDFSANEKSSPETMVSDCAQLKEALNNSAITNIRINGHIKCDESINFKNNKIIYGSNRNTDKIEFITVAGFVSGGNMLKFSNLTLIGGDDGTCNSLLPRAIITLENITIEAQTDTIFSKGSGNDYSLVMKGQINLETYRRGSCNTIRNLSTSLYIDNGAVVTVNIYNERESTQPYDGSYRYLYIEDLVSYGEITGISSLSTSGALWVEKAGNGLFIKEIGRTPTVDVLTDGATYSRNSLGEIIAGNNVTLNVNSLGDLAAGAGITINYFTQAGASSELITKTFTDGFSPYITKEVTYSSVIR